MDLATDHYLELFSFGLDIDLTGGVLLSLFNQNTEPILSSINNNYFDWSTISESLGLVCDIPLTSYKTSFIKFNTAKLSGVLILLGVSTYWCYKCLKAYFPRTRSCSRSSNHNKNHEHLETPTPPENGGNSIFSWSPLNLVDNYLNLQTRYFGPLNPDQIDEEDPTPPTRYDDFQIFCYSIVLH
uniref:Uncharacterized protein n=1 Tax=Clastoptera arizonana TaxID=38151 RepID=A0A1B6CKG5_9HEMI